MELDYDAVVFAYHDVGVRCLGVLLAHGVNVRLVVTHSVDPNENVWFDSVEKLARANDIEVATPEDPNAPAFLSRVQEISPDFIFSFYYRRMLSPAILESAMRGAFNMHGSLLPKYRGRAPVNWAILRGEHETGATLHYMVERADAGDIVDSQAVPILLDDDAREVFTKVTVAAETVLARSLPALIAGTAARRPQPILAGHYFGRRRPEDGRIDWSRPALEIHNLVRAVAPPFPGAFGNVAGERWEIQRTRLAEGISGPRGASLFGAGGRCYLSCGDGAVLRLLAAAYAGGPVDLAALAERAAHQPLPLG